MIPVHDALGLHLAAEAMSEKHCWMTDHSLCCGLRSREGKPASATRPHSRSGTVASICVASIRDAGSVLHLCNWQVQPRRSDTSVSYACAGKLYLIQYYPYSLSARHV